MAKTIGQTAPLGATSQYPQNRLDKLATGHLTAYANTDNFLQTCQQLDPFAITQFAFVHTDQKGRDSTFALRQQSLDERERYANFILPTLRNPTEVWATRYDDATVRNRYIKIFTGSKYDMVVIVRVDPDGSIFWNMMPRERKKMNDLRIGERVFDGT